MRYDSLRKSALSHRGVIAIAAVALLALTTGSALIAANPPATNSDPYKVTFLFTFQDDQYIFSAQVVDSATGKLVANPRVRSKIGLTAEVTERADPGLALNFKVSADAARTGTMHLEVTQDGREIQKVTMLQTPSDSSPSSRQYTGEPISLNLRNAEIKDVLRTFAQIAGMDLEMDPNLEGTVTLDIKGMPWDEALDMIAKQHGLRVKVEGNKISIGR